MVRDVAAIAVDSEARTDPGRTPPTPRTVLTFGTFDVFHVGHLRVIERAAQHGDRLIVGVSSDALNLSKKGREPVFSQGERLAIVGALKPVDEVFVEESLELKRHYIEQYAADVLVMGDDWAGRFDEFEDVCEVVYLPRTPAISTTALIEKISGPGPEAASGETHRRLACSTSVQLAVLARPMPALDSTHEPRSRHPSTPADPTTAVRRAARRAPGRGADHRRGARHRRDLAAGAGGQRGRTRRRCWPGLGLLLLSIPLASTFAALGVALPRRRRRLDVRPAGLRRPRPRPWWAGASTSRSPIGAPTAAGFAGAYVADSLGGGRTDPAAGQRRDHRAGRDDELVRAAGLGPGAAGHRRRPRRRCCWPRPWSRSPTPSSAT